MSIRWKINNQMEIVQRVILLLLFFAGMNIFNQYYYLCFLSCLFFLLIIKKFVIDIDFILLFILGISWLSFSPTEITGIGDIARPFLYVMMYVTGVNYLRYENDGNLYEQKDFILKSVIIIISLGPAVHFLLNWIYNLNSGQIILTNDIWTKDVLSATGQAAMACMMVGVLSAILFTQIKILYKSVAVIILILIQIYNLTLGGRTIIFMTTICIFASLFFILLFQKMGYRKRKAILILISIIIIGYLIYFLNAFNIQEYIYNSGFYRRFLGDYQASLFQDSRISNKLFFLKEFKMSLFGGANIRELGIGYAHGLLLDTYDEAGIFALLGLGTYLIRAIVRASMFIRNKNNGFDIRLIVFSLYLAIFIEFSIEPVLQGIPWLFALFCFVDGITKSCNRYNDKICLVKVTN